MIHTQQVIDTIYSADTVEACPISYNVIACGTYQVDEEKNSPGHTERMGRLYLYHLENNTLIEFYQQEMNAILDMKWHFVYFECI